MKPVSVFVAPSGNGFMTDIATWLVEAATLCGRSAQLVTDSLPHDTDRVNLVVAPHEFYVLRHDTDAEVRRAAAISVPVCTEQPGTPWYHLGLGFCRTSPLVLDINSHGAAALRADGLDARHLRLGGVPSMAAPLVERDIDVLFLGGLTPRRAGALAALAPSLWHRRSELRTFTFSAPVRGAVPGLVFGSAKYALLARSTLLINLHRDDSTPGYFEWARMVEAMANGCTVVTEPSTGYEPLVDGVHFVSTGDVAATIEALLDDRAALSAVGGAARRAVLEESPLDATLGPLLEEAETVSPKAVRRRRVRRREPIIRSHRPPIIMPLRPAEPLRQRAFAALMKELELQRSIQRVRCRVRYGTDDYIERIESPSYQSAQPDVSVLVTLFNYESLVARALESIVASPQPDAGGVSYDIVVVDDHSVDGGRAVVQEFIDTHPDVPLLLLGCETNRGLSAARNLAIEHARATKLMMLDADNELYPSCLKALSAALDGDSGAAFAYGTIEDFGVTPGVRSAMAWHVPWLCERNYIDAQAMIRRSVFERHGGYRLESEWAYGWEDWELWLRLAAAGEYGVHVPNFVGRYRTQASSMLTITNLVHDRMLADLRASYPLLAWPAS